MRPNQRLERNKVARSLCFRMGYPNEPDATPSGIPLPLTCLKAVLGDRKRCQEPIFNSESMNGRHVEFLDGEGLIR